VKEKINTESNTENRISLTKKEIEVKGKGPQPGLGPQGLAANHNDQAKISRGGAKLKSDGELPKQVKGKGEDETN